MVGKMKKIVLGKQNIKRIGRSLMVGDVLWTALSGSGVAFTFTGKKLVVTIQGSDNAKIENNDTNYARLAIYVNGERIIDDMLNCEEKTYTVAESDVPQSLQVQIMKVSESPMSAMGIEPLLCDEDAVIIPVEPKKHSIEFIGDSITCGYGTDDEDMTHTFSTATEDVTKAYAYKTAKLLDADYSMFSASGYGIISGYTADPQVRGAAELIPPFYESQCFSRDSFKEAGYPADIPWDFKEYQPEVIVINLGTNDDSYCQDTVEKQEEYVKQYIEFLKVVRKNNPRAEIFCVLGLMGDRLYPRVCEAAEGYTAQTGDERIHTVHIPEQDGNVGYVIDYHPLPQMHTMASEVVAAAIKETINW